MNLLWKPQTQVHNSHNYCAQVNSNNARHWHSEARQVSETVQLLNLYIYSVQNSNSFNTIIKIQTFGISTKTSMYIKQVSINPIIWYKLCRKKQKCF